VTTPLDRFFDDEAGGDEENDDIPGLVTPSDSEDELCMAVSKVDISSDSDDDV
jgi:hypothetical protein